MTRSAKVIVVGTSHPIQVADRDFESFLHCLCQTFAVRAVAEEMSAEALGETKCSTSVLMRIAKSLGVAHRFCDPNRRERVELQIDQESNIRAQALLPGWSEAEIAQRVIESHAKRERYWLAHLRGLDQWPVLFVCGAGHVASFSQLLEQERITAHVAADDWASNNTVERDAPQAARPSL